MTKTVDIIGSLLRISSDILPSFMDVFGMGNTSRSFKNPGSRRPRAAWAHGLLSDPPACHRGRREVGTSTRFESLRPPGMAIATAIGPVASKGHSGISYYNYRNKVRY